MTRNDQLIGALGKLLPGATFRVDECRNWCSITFSGQRLKIVADLEKKEQAQLFATALPEQEFALTGAIVADIAVVNMRNNGENLCLEIDALILDE